MKNIYVERGGDELLVWTADSNLPYSLYFVLKYRGWNLRNFKNILRINSWPGFWNEHNFVCWKFAYNEILSFQLNRIKFFLTKDSKTSLKATKTVRTSRMVDADNISARSYGRLQWSASWLQNYFNNTIRHQIHAFENRKVIRYDLRIFTRIFSAYNR